MQIPSFPSSNTSNDTGFQCPQTRDAAIEADARDPLRHARDAFALPEALIYLIGNSLGPATHAALDAVAHASTHEWAHGLVRSWNSADWFTLPLTAGARIAPMIGAAPEEVLICDSVSVNLFKLTAAMLDITKPGRCIIVEEDEFPTDQYIAEQTAAMKGVDFLRVKSGTGPQTLSQRQGVLIKSIVNYKTAAIADMAEAEEIARQSGGAIVWDLSHGTGAVSIDLKDAGAKVATGCTYKFLNGGPGAPAFIYAEEAIVDQLQTPLPGWMGHAAPFTFTNEYSAKTGVARFASGTPPILSLRALSAALDVFHGLDITMLERKARTLGDLFLTRARNLGLETISPAIGERRGGHVSLLHDDGYAIVKALAAEGVIGDFRAPNIMRFAFSPLFVRYQDVWDAADRLEDILRTKRWDNATFKAKEQVT